MRTPPQHQVRPLEAPSLSAPAYHSEQSAKLSDNLTHVLLQDIFTFAWEVCCKAAGMHKTFTMQAYVDN